MVFRGLPGPAGNFFVKNKIISKAMADAREEKVEACEAFATMVTSNSYVVGAVVLASSIQSASARRPVVCMVSPQVSAESRKVLRGAGMELVDVAGRSTDCLCGRAVMFALVVPRLFASAACADIAAPRTSDVEAWNQSGYTKLNLWTLVRYSKIVYIDADCLVVERSPEHLSRRHIRAGVVGRFASSPPLPTPRRSPSSALPCLRAAWMIYSDGRPTSQQRPIRSRQIASTPVFSSCAHLSRCFRT
jgi:hypothetical protein